MGEDEFRARLDEEFTPSTPAMGNYIPRDKIDQLFLDAVLEPGHQIVVFGPTGVGKTSLVRSKLSELQLTFLDFPCHEDITDTNIFPKVMQKLGFEKPVESKKQKSTEKSADAEAGAKLWSLVDFKGRVGTRSQRISENTTIPYHNDADLDAVAEALVKTDCVLFLDDVEKVRDDKLRLKLAHLGKRMSDLAGNAPTHAKIVYAGIAQDAGRLIEIDDSLRSRLSNQKIKTLTDAEIKTVLENGWANLGFTVETDVNFVVTICCGFPRYAHWIGKQAALSAFRAKRTTILEQDVREAVLFILENFSGDLKLRWDKATQTTKGSKGLREKILVVMAKSGANELHHTDILAGVSELVGEKLKPEQLSGPLGELRQAERGALLEAGSKMGFHRFRDLMMKPYIRLRLAAKDTK